MRWPFASRTRQGAEPEQAAPIAALPDYPPYLIRQSAPHRWQLLKLFPTADGEGCYSYPHRAASNCICREEAERFLQMDLTGEWDRSKPAVEPSGDYRAYYDAAGNLVKEDGEALIPACHVGR